MATADKLSPASEAARRAIGQITHQPFEAQPKAPARLLTDEARRYHTHAIRFPGDSLVIWTWDDASQTPVPKTVSKSDAESYFGLKLARAALAADPNDRATQAVFLSLAARQGDRTHRVRQISGR